MEELPQSPAKPLTNEEMTVSEPRVRVRARKALQMRTIATPKGLQRRLEKPAGASNILAEVIQVMTGL